MKLESLLKDVKKNEVNQSKATVYVYTKKGQAKLKKELKGKVSSWEESKLSDYKPATLSGENGPVLLIPLSEDKTKLHHGTLTKSKYAFAREEMGKNVSKVLELNSKEVTVSFLDLDSKEITGAIVGIELALYRFKSSMKLGRVKFLKNGKELSKKDLTEAVDIAVAINQARHLVNLPPNHLNPVTYAKGIQKMYAKSKKIKVNVIDEKELRKEKCGLLLSVGESSNNKPRIVHLSYKGDKKKGAKTTALVGKGLTFDSGGLNIKSGAGMRLMKKDMGGSATLIGFSRWLENSGIKKNIDIYVALAENAISENASRPSDIYTSRSGLEVEIHNTDAEGRLAMADAISIALDKNPDVLIDMATLTGAGKVALGQDIASLFSNNDSLADKLVKASTKMGDLSWRMPLFDTYFSGLKSDFADMANAASGHGGAITAALFLEKFVGKTKWAHFDIFGWTSGNKPSLVQKGGSGQGVETLIGYFK